MMEQKLKTKVAERGHRAGSPSVVTERGQWAQPNWSQGVVEVETKQPTWKYKVLRRYY